jgi:3-isopropylmalate/(R)-2-methylmalate dehydratase small subunit
MADGTSHGGARYHDTALRVRRVQGEISTDDIIPARYKHRFTDPAMLAPHVFEHRFPGLAETFRRGDALVGRDILGIGSSREQAVSALRACGVRLVVAPAFGRIFYRNCWNLGLPAIEADTALLAEGEQINLDLTGGRITGSAGCVSFAPPARMMIDMVEAGGLLAMVFAAAGPAGPWHADPGPAGPGAPNLTSQIG